MNRTVFAAALVSTALIGSLASATGDSISTEGLTNPFPERPYSPYADRPFSTEVYFGDTHAHTALSADAGGAGARLLPRDS